MLLKVSSLNFSGINISPFEYHDGSSQKTHINSCFKKLLTDYQRENPKEYGSIAKLDLVFQKNRYTILYKNNVGILRGKLVGKEQFETIWDLMFQQNQQNLKSIPVKAAEVETLKSFDRMIYQAFLESVYGVINWSRIKEYNPEPYQLELAKWHSKCYLKLDKKSDLLREYLIRKDLDILFVQQAEMEHISKTLPPTYTYTHSSKSMIILKKDLFVKDPDAARFQAKYGETLDFNKDSTFIKFKDHLLISVHLSSKKIKAEQLENLKQTLIALAKEQPTLKIIMGIDANQFIKSVRGFHTYPDSEECFTTRKRRTDMQLQFQKAGLIVEDVKDHIITNLQMASMNVQTIKCQPQTQQFLPNQHHPFDHFAVYSTISNELSEASEENHVALVSEQRKDCKSVSTLDSIKKSANFGNYGKAGEIESPLTPSIIVSPCEQPPSNENVFHELDCSSRNSHRSKNSYASKSPRTKYVETPCLNILKFRKSPLRNQPLVEQQKTQSNIKQEKSIFKFREINRSRSVQKSNEKAAKQAMKRIFPIQFNATSSRRQQNINSQTHLSPTPTPSTCPNPHRYYKYTR